MSMSAICGLFGKTRQGWYKQRSHVENKVLKEAVVVELVKEQRADMPKVGCRKLHYLLSPILAEHSLSLGRDGLFDIVAANGLQIRRRKRRKAITTDSNHPFRKYGNLVRELVPDRSEQLWVSDITYIQLKGQYCYLSLITDAYSRRIMGHCLWPSLKKEGPLQALSMALSSRTDKGLDLIHHSDRGLQYCCADYISKLNASRISISMTEKGDPYENALAERINGILKTEFGLDGRFESFEQAKLVVQKAINVYNEQRPHASIDYMTPQQAHQQNGVIATRWKARKRLQKQWVNPEPLLTESKDK